MLVAMDMSAPVADPLELALQRELRAGERVLWRGRRVPRFAWEALVIWVFAIPWTAFSLFWTGMAFMGAQAFRGDAGVFAYVFPLFGTPFVAVGFGMLSAPFVPLFGAHRTLFAVTDQRLLRLYLGGRLKTKSVGGRSIGAIERNERRTGTGTLKIVIGSHRDSDGDRQTDHFELGEVADVMMAETRVRELVDRSRRATVNS